MDGNLQVTENEEKAFMSGQGSPKPDEDDDYGRFGGV